MRADVRAPRALLFPTFVGFAPAWLGADLIAGLMLAAIAIPEQIATARLAGMPAQAGLYAFAAGSLAFACFGANRYLSVGADSTIAPIFASGIALIGAGATQANQVAIVALIAGATLLLAGILRAGWVADLLSIPVTVGFLAGIAVHIIVGQLPLVLGIDVPAASPLPRLVDIVRHAGAANGPSIAIGVTVLALALGAERISPKVPGALIGLIGSGIAVALLGLQGHGVAVLDPLPRALPAVTLPRVTLDLFWRLVPVGLIVALVCMMQTAAVVRAFPSRRDAPEPVSRDFAAVGIGSILAAFVGGFAVDSSPPRTAVVEGSGGKSQLASIVAVAAIALLIAFAARFAAYIPAAALGGVLVFIGLRILRIKTIGRIAQRGGYEILLVAAALFAVVLLPIERGMLVAIMLSLVHGFYVVARPPSTELFRIAGTTVWWPPGGDLRCERVPGVLVFDPAAPIAFTNAEFVTHRLRDLVAAAVPPVQLVVIEASSVIYVDYTGARALRHAIRRLIAGGTAVAIARLSDPRAQAAAVRMGLIDAVGKDHVFNSVEEAVIALDPRAAAAG